MIDVVRSAAALLATLAAVPIWLVPGSGPPAAAATTAEAEAKASDEAELDGCTFLFINRYFPDDGRQEVRTRQDRTDDCTFGGRGYTIRVKVCFADPQGGTPVDCSSWLMPTSQEPYAVSTIVSPVPRDSIHYYEIHDVRKRFDLPAPEVPPPPSSAPVPPPEPATEPSPEPTDSPSPTTTGPAPDDHSAPAEVRQVDEEQKAAPARPDDRRGLAAVLATSGAARRCFGSAAPASGCSAAAGPAPGERPATAGTRLSPGTRRGP